MACCKDCTTRAIGCHGDCERYKLYREQRDKLIESNQTEGVNKGYVCERQNKIRKITKNKRGKL